MVRRAGESMSTPQIQLRRSFVQRPTGHWLQGCLPQSTCRSVHRIPGGQVFTNPCAEDSNAGMRHPFSRKPSPAASGSDAKLGSNHRKCPYASQRHDLRRAEPRYAPRKFRGTAWESGLRSTIGMAALVIAFAQIIHAAVPAPVARWAFDGNASDDFWKMDGTLVGGAKIENGHLVLDGTAYVRTAPLPAELGAMTLAAQVKVSLPQRPSCNGPPTRSRQIRPDSPGSEAASTLRPTMPPGGAWDSNADNPPGISSNATSTAASPLRPFPSAVITECQDRP